MRTLSEQVAVDGLRERIAGDVFAPGDDGFDEARLAWNLAADQRPAAVAFPESEQDVIEIVRHARESGLRVSAQGTGHNATAIETLEDTVLVRTSRIKGVEVDPAARIGRAGAGVLWQEFTPLAHEHGLAVLAGSVNDIGVVGYSLGGGLGWLGRKHGLQTNSVTAVEIVTADGELKRVDAERHPDLFWALRGGGGSFGVVTALEFRLYPIREVYAGMLTFPWERAAEVFHAWREWVDTVPDEVTSTARILQIPPAEEIPEILRGKDIAILEVVYIGDEEDGARIVEPLVALGPELDTFGMVPAPALQLLHMDPPEPMPGTSDHTLLSDFTHEAIDALVEATGPGSGSPLMMVELRHLGGALGRVEEGAGALARFDAEFLFFTGGMAATPDMTAAMRAHMPLAREAVARWDAGSAYLNFVENPEDPARFFAPDTYRRLQEVKTVYDPEDLFRSNHPIPPVA